MTPVLALLPSLGGMEWIILIVLGVLLFGRKLPDVGRSLGKGIVEFKKGLKGLEDEVDTTSTTAALSEPAAEAPRPPQRIAAPAPKFETQPTEAEKPGYS